MLYAPESITVKNSVNCLVYSYAKCAKLKLVLVDTHSESLSVVAV